MKNSAPSMELNFILCKEDALSCQNLNEQKSHTFFNILLANYSPILYYMAQKIEFELRR